MADASQDQFRKEFLTRQAYADEDLKQDLLRRKGGSSPSISQGSAPGGKMSTPEIAEQQYLLSQAKKSDKETSGAQRIGLSFLKSQPENAAKFLRNAGVKVTPIKNENSGAIENYAIKDKNGEVYLADKEGATWKDFLDFAPDLLATTGAVVGGVLGGVGGAMAGEAGAEVVGQGVVAALGGEASALPIVAAPIPGAVIDVAGRGAKAAGGSAMRVVADRPTPGQILKDVAEQKGPDGRAALPGSGTEEAGRAVLRQRMADFESVGIQPDMATLTGSRKAADYAAAIRKVREGGANRLDVREQMMADQFEKAIGNTLEKMGTKAGSRLDIGDSAEKAFTDYSDLLSKNTQKAARVSMGRVEAAAPGRRIKVDAYADALREGIEQAKRDIDVDPRVIARAEAKIEKIKNGISPQEFDAEIQKLSADAFAAKKAVKSRPLNFDEKFAGKNFSAINNDLDATILAAQNPSATDGLKGAARQGRQRVLDEDSAWGTELRKFRDEYASNKSIEDNFRDSIHKAATEGLADNSFVAKALSTGIEATHFRNSMSMIAKTDPDRARQIYRGVADAITNRAKDANGDITPKSLGHALFGKTGDSAQLKDKLEALAELSGPGAKQTMRSFLNVVAVMGAEKTGASRNSWMREKVRKMAGNTGDPLVSAMEWMTRRDKFARIWTEPELMKDFFTLVAPKKDLHGRIDWALASRLVQRLGGGDDESVKIANSLKEAVKAPPKKDEN